MVDPKTGEIKKVQLARARRLRVIFDTNIKQAYSAGAWERFERNKARRPFLKYQAVRDDRTRDRHAAWHGTIRPVDDPFWQTHTPMNGWHCRCYLVSTTKREMKLRGEDVYAPPKIKEHEWFNARTGKTVRVPEGIDPGFDFNVGAKGRRIASLSRAAANSQAQFNRVMKGTDYPLLNKMTPDQAASLGKQRLNEILNTAGIKINGKQMPLKDALRKLKAATLSERLEFQFAFRDRLLVLLEDRRGRKRVESNVTGQGGGAKLIREASRHFPDEWVQATNTLGPLRAKRAKKVDLRGWHYTESGDSMLRRIPLFGVKRTKKGDGWIVTNTLGTAIHEYTHRIQSALPDLDGIFQAEHLRRTEGSKLNRLRDLTKLSYKRHEITREDKYINPYFGREYPEGGAIEVLTMTFETILSPVDLESSKNMIKLLSEDTRLASIALGVLFHWKVRK